MSLHCYKEMLLPKFKLKQICSRCANVRAPEANLFIYLKERCSAIQAAHSASTEPIAQHPRQMLMP